MLIAIPLPPAQAESPESAIASCRSLGPDHVPSALKDSQSGAITRVRCYRGDTLDGPARNYGATGDALLEGDYKDGQMEGHWRRKDETGKLLDEGSWSNGKPSGTWRVYTQSSQAYVEQEYAADGSVLCQSPSSSPEQKSCVRSFLPAERRFHGVIRLEGMALRQESGGFSIAPNVGADLRFKISNWFALTLGADQTALASYSGPRYLGTTQAQGCLAFIRIPFLMLAVGGGAQWWWNMTRPYPHAHAQLSIRTAKRWLFIFQEIQVSGTFLFFPDDPAFVGRVGLGIPL